MRVPLVAFATTALVSFVAATLREEAQVRRIYDGHVTRGGCGEVGGRQLLLHPRLQ